MSQMVIPTLQEETPLYFVGPRAMRIPKKQSAEFVKVLLVEDNELLSLSLSIQLESQPQFKLVGCAKNGEEAIQLAVKLLPDIILMDITLPKLDGIQATKVIRDILPESNIIMLTCHTQIEKVFQSYDCGANAYCLKDIEMDTLLDIMTNPLDKDIWIDPAISLMIRNTSKDGNTYVSYQKVLYKD